MIDYPLISCIMPTTGKRRRFVEQSIRLFNAQDYPNKELIIVDEPDYYGTACSEVAIPQSNIEYIFIDTLGTEASLTVGAKRNLACSLAKGEIICLWDDDDWVSPQRLSRQAQPIIEYEADMTGFTLDVVFDVTSWTAWKCSPVLRKEIFPSDLITGATMFRKRLWGWMASFPSISNGEDADFVNIAASQGAELKSLENTGDFIYIRHDRYAWPLPPHYHSHMHEWQCVPIEQYLGAEQRTFYERIRYESSHSK